MTKGGVERLLSEPGSRPAAPKNRPRRPTAAPGRGELFWERKIQHALQVIDVSLGHRLTLSYLSGMLDMSPCHFAHRFKRAVGMAPHKYVIQRRVQRAKTLLASTELPIVDVALAVGCANQSHFSAVFRRVTGVSPHSYRRGRSGEPRKISIDDPLAPR